MTKLPDFNIILNKYPGSILKKYPGIILKISWHHSKDFSIILKYLQF